MGCVRHRPLLTISGVARLGSRIQILNSQDLNAAASTESDNAVTYHTSFSKRFFFNVVKSPSTVGHMEFNASGEETEWVIMGTAVSLII